MCTILVYEIFFLLKNNYTFDKQNMDTIIKNLKQKNTKKRQDKELQILTLYCNKEDKAKNKKS